MKNNSFNDLVLRTKSTIKYAGGDFLIALTSSIAISSERFKILKPLKFINRVVLCPLGYSMMPIKTMEMSREDDVVEHYQVIKDHREGISVVSTTPSVKSECIHSSMPDLYMAVLKNVIIASNSDIIINPANNTIISDDCYNKSRNILCMDNLLYRERSNWGIVRKLYKKSPISINAGIMISGKYSGNYYHSLYENLNRLLLIDEDSIPLEIPIIVDETSSKIPSLNQLINYLQKFSKRNIITISTKDIYKINTLYYFNHINKLIPHRINPTYGESEDNLYDPLLIKEQRSVLLSHKSIINTPKRIFLTRANSSARCFNEDDILDVLKKYGFEKIAPEKYSFEDQISLFNNADFIIGGTGAAFANVIFCSPKCRVMCIRSLKGEIGDTVFKSIAWINNIEFWHYSPDSITSGKGVHANYYVNPQRFNYALESLWGNVL